MRGGRGSCCSGGYDNGGSGSCCSGGYGNDGSDSGRGTAMMV